MKNDNRNNFDKRVKMHLACDDDKSHPVYNCIYFNGGFAYATDGHILVRNRISEMSGLEEHEIAALDGRFLNSGFYKDILKYDNITIAKDGIECSKGDKREFFRFSKFDKYPNADKVIQNALNMRTTPMPQIKFDMDLMQRLNNALYNSDKCVATFKGTNKPIVFTSIDDNVSSIGLIMPCYTGD